MRKIYSYPSFPDSLEFEARRQFDLPEPTPFIAHENLVRLAKRNRPKTISPTVSAFTDWVYDLYVHKRDEGSIQRGRKFESWFRSLCRENRKDPLYARKQARKDGCRIEPKLLSQWEVEYEDPLDTPDEFFRISALVVKGRAIVGRPDMVYRQRGTRNVLIVEHKSFWKLDEIPQFGWPNLKTQLWCYGMFDKWRDAPQIFLMGRVFDMGRFMNEKDLSLRGHPEYRACQISDYIFNTKILCANDPRVNRECLELFTLFGGSSSNIESK